MIRLLLLTFIPLIVPFAVWFHLAGFSGTPKIDPQTGDQVPPDLRKRRAASFSPRAWCS